jgi:hypothetical protein
MINIDKVWGEGCQRWIDEHRAEGWTPYYVNFMFRALRGKPEIVLEQMKRSIHKEFYTPFMMRFVRDPHREAEQDRMPRMMLFPDLPVFKQDRASDRTTQMNAGGLHYNGAMLIPPVSRFFGCPVAFIDEHRHRYTQGKIARIHVKSVDHKTGRLSDYSVKTVMRADKFKCSAADESHILMLPRALSEVRRKHVDLLPDQKAIRDIQAALNVSDDVAVSMTGGVGTSR